MLCMYFNTFYDNASHHSQIPVFEGNSQKYFTHIPHLLSEKINLGLFSQPVIFRVLLPRLFYNPTRLFTLSLNMFELNHLEARLEIQLKCDELIDIFDSYIEIFPRTSFFFKKRPCISYLLFHLTFLEILRKRYFFLVYPELIFQDLSNLALLDSNKQKPKNTIIKELKKSYHVLKQFKFYQI